VTRAFERIAVLGLGLLGGSVALAARRRGIAGRVAGATRRADARRAALRSGAVDEAGDYESAVRGADLVVLATPVNAMAELTRRIAPALRDDAIVTDVGSVKGMLVDTLPGLLPRGVRYVGSHPMAGGHERGVEHARADLFEGAACVVMRSGDPEARERVVGFWRALGARVVLLDAEEHDARVAWVSHLPHALAFAFASVLAEAPEGALDVQGAGFRDFTRIARSDAELWADILTSNRKALAAPLQAVARALEGLARALESEDVEAVERILAAARAALAGGGAPGVRISDRQPAPPTARRPGGAGEQNHR
jgi:prephenate dehydrogenase